MSVFLRWGIFGILGVAALLYAYNASKRMAENRAQNAPAPPAQTTPSNAPATVAQAQPVAQVAPVAAQSRPPAPPSPAHCETELAVAKRALEARQRGDPLDRLLRIQEIAFESWAPRRARLEQVATRYFNYEGDFVPEALRIAVISDCVMHAPTQATIPAS